MSTPPLLLYPLFLQRRASEDVGFFRDWASYRDGFGDMKGNFWLGLEDVHQLTSKGKWELRIELSYNGQDYFAHYDNFKVHSESDLYRLEISGYSGTAGDSLLGTAGRDVSKMTHSHNS